MNTKSCDITGFDIPLGLLFPKKSHINMIAVVFKPAHLMGVLLYEPRLQFHSCLLGPDAGSHFCVIYSEF